MSVLSGPVGRIASHPEEAADGPASPTDATEFVSESFQPSSQDVQDMKRDVSSITSHMAVGNISNNTSMKN